MDSNTVDFLKCLIVFGWIPILALGKAISWCIEARTCGKCTCKEYMKEES